MPSTCFEPSWEWTHEVQNTQKTSKIEKFNQNINFKSVHFVGSWCIRIFLYYGHRKQTSPCLILISLLFDDSCKGKKGTCPSDLAIVLSGRHYTHLVTLSSMSVLTNYWHSFSTPFCSHLHWCISITSTYAAWCDSASVTSPVGLSGLALAVCKQTNIHIQIHTTISYFINQCSSMPHICDWLFLKQWLCHVKQHNRILLSLFL